MGGGRGGTWSASALFLGSKHVWNMRPVGKEGEAKEISDQGR